MDSHLATSILVDELSSQASPMTDFHIDQYEITVTVEEDDDGGDAGESTSAIVQVPLRPVSHPPKRTIAKDGELFSRWIFYHLYHHRNLQPEKIALIEEVTEARCVTYGELVDGAIKAANFLSHHGIKKGDRIAMCMENSVEYVFYQLAAYLIGAVPVLLNPGHVASDRFDSIECSAAVVDFDHYGHILRSTTLFQSLQHVFILSDELSSIYIPPHLWIYDAFGFLDFPSVFRKSMPMQDGPVTIFSSSGTIANKCKFVTHTSKSSQLMCCVYYEKLFDLLVETDPDYTAINGHHLITSGLHCIDAWSYLYFSLVKGETCVLAESTVDVWRASFLDRIAGLIEQYRIPLILSNAQLLKCFIKYEVHNIYDISSLKLIANSGLPIAAHLARKVKQMLNVAITQAYASAEFGVVSFDLFCEAAEGVIVASGVPFGDMHIKVADVDNETEVSTDEWGHVMLQGDHVFSSYAGVDDKTNQECFAKNWFRSGDYGMVDQKHRLHIAGPVKNLINYNGKKMSPEVVESILCEHDSIDDVVVAVINDEISAGLLLGESSPNVTADDLNSILKRNKIDLRIAKAQVLDFIPRSETGKLMRAELPYLFSAEQDDVVIIDNTNAI